MPIPIADPTGTVLATAVVAWVITMARQNPSPGVTAIHTSAFDQLFAARQLPVEEATGILADLAARSLAQPSSTPTT